MLPLYSFEDIKVVNEYANSVHKKSRKNKTTIIFFKNRHANLIHKILKESEQSLPARNPKDKDCIILVEGTSTHKIIHKLNIMKSMQLKGTFNVVT